MTPLFQGQRFFFAFQKNKSKSPVLWSESPGTYAPVKGPPPKGVDVISILYIYIYIYIYLYIYIHLCVRTLYHENPITPATSSLRTLNDEPTLDLVSQLARALVPWLRDESLGPMIPF